MKLTYESFEREALNALRPLYLFTGDEAVLIKACRQQLIEKSQKHGFIAREIFYVDSSFSWQDFLATLTQRSLFSQKRIIDVRFFSGKLDSAAQSTLTKHLEKPNNDVLLMLSMPKLEAGVGQLKVMKKIEQEAAWVTLYPLTLEKAAFWLQKKAQSLGLRLSTPVTQYLAHSNEGHLEAACQELERWTLLFDRNQTIDEPLLIEQILPQQKFNPFQLTDTIFSGDHAKAIMMLKLFKQEEVDAHLVVWAIAKELQTLSQLAIAEQKGERLYALFPKFQIWKNRQPLIELALRQMSAQHYLMLLAEISSLDQVTKGIEADNIWRKLEQLLLKWFSLIHRKNH